MLRAMGSSGNWNEKFGPWQAPVWQLDLSNLKAQWGKSRLERNLGVTRTRPLEVDGSHAFGLSLSITMGSSGSQAFSQAPSDTTGFLGPLVCRWQMVRFLTQHSCVSLVL